MQRPPRSSTLPITLSSHIPFAFSSRMDITLWASLVPLVATGFKIGLVGRLVRNYTTIVSYVAIPLSQNKTYIACRA
jgi:hypothetical protein